MSAVHQVGLRPARRTTPTGARPTSAGSPATATSSTVRCANGATTLMYEGAPNHPREDRFWDIIEKYRVNIFYTAPTAIRAFIKWGDQWPKKHDLSSLRLLGTVGEPINPEAWMWYHEVIGRKRCPIVDTWWQTETGMIMIAPLPGAIATKPGSCTRPFPGVVAEVVDQAGQRRAAPTRAACSSSASPGRRCCAPSTATTNATSSSTGRQVPHCYFTADGARRTRTATSGSWAASMTCSTSPATASAPWKSRAPWSHHPKVAEAAVVGKPDEIKGEGIACFVTLDRRRRSRPRS